uniref:PERQ amino acid-rich with GYF domain-containing protein 2-like n=1 Tax=Sinocyclocheilus rhinocerous TaxID=307959 RepID=A0A673HB02_9TELE
MFCAVDRPRRRLPRYTRIYVTVEKKRQSQLPFHADFKSIYIFCAELLIETVFFFRLSRKMAETQTLNFGPEWLRALSGGVGSSSVTSPPLSPALPKYKLADYRYGREEMLALYVKDDMIPVDLHDKEFLPILQEEPLPPLALVPFTEEEQRNFSMSINSAAVLRLTGRGGGTVAGAPRGRSSSRGRGRGRGDGGFYQRSFDDVEGGFGRGGREMHRSQSWEERGDRRFEKPGRKDPVRPNYEDAGAGNARKNEFIRSESDNWRMSRDEQNGEDDDGGWRIAGSRRDNERWCPPSPDGPRSAGWREHPDQRRRFPFDSRGEDGGYRRPQSGSGSLEEERDSLPEWCLEDAEEETGTFDSSGAFLSLKKAPKEPILEEAELDFQPLEENEECTEKDDSESEQTKDTDTESSRRESDRNEGEKAFTSSFYLMEQEAEKMVAYLQDGGVDDERLATKIGRKPTALTITHEAAFKWFYKDPQGEIQGPFNNQEMSEWFQAGYFTMTLQVKRGCDEMFQPLGEMMKLWGRVPFTPGPTLPPILGDEDQERMKRQQEINVLNMYQLQQLQYQYLLRYDDRQTPELQQSLLPPVTRSMSVPDSGSVWEMQNPSTEASSWEGSSVWDLPLDSMPQASSIEQMQMEKAKALKQEEERRKQEELEAQRRLEEEEAAAAALERQQQEEQKRNEQEAQRQQELQRQRQQQQEEQKRNEQEAQRQQELQRQRQQQQEALRRLQQQQQQQQLAQMKLPSSSKWGQQSTTASTLSQSQNALSLAEIQKLEEERERQTLEEQRRQLQEFQRAQQQQPQAKLSGWGNVTKQPAATKSLLEIQREEAQQMKQRKEQQQQQPQQQPQQQHQQQNSTAPNSSVWGSVNNVGYNWMMDSSSVWGDAQNSNIGFWDEAVKEATPPQATRKSHNQKNKDNANLSNSSSGKASKKVEEEEKLLKLFQGANKNQDGFMQWCEQTLHTLNTANNLDVPTFASFLKEVDSPYEVHDYVRAYLGDTPQAKDFAKQFLERRAKQNANQQKPQQGQQQKQQDSVWGLSQVSQSVLHQQQQQQRFETVTSGKKKKKQKMVRADPSLLGFSVNASSERLNMGEIESVEDI